MIKEQLIEFIGLKENEDFDVLGAKVFERVVYEKLKNFGFVERQVMVPDRGDGRRGYIDIVFTPFGGETVAIEIDRKSIRHKSIFKVGYFQKSFLITRSPYKVYDYQESLP